MNAFVDYLVSMLRRGWRMFLTVMKVMLPVIALVQIAQYFGVVEWVGRLIEPIMGLLNLPPEAGIIWATTLLTGIYGGIATLSSLTSTLELTSGQLAALGSMMLIAHAIPVEQSIVRKAGASFWLTAALRIGTALAYGGFVAWASHLTGVLNDPVSLDWIRGGVTDSAGGTGVWAWVKGTTFSLAMTLAIIIALVIVLDALERAGVTRRISAMMMPVLRFSGLDAKVAPVTTVGVMLGLTYGGALIIEEAKTQNYPPRTRFLALSWLSLSHSLIEDTLLLAALGSNIWIILVGRVLITLIIVAILARLTNRGAWRLSAAAA